MPERASLTSFWDEAKQRSELRWNGHVIYGSFEAIYELHQLMLIVEDYRIAASAHLRTIATESDRALEHLSRVAKPIDAMGKAGAK